MDIVIGIGIGLVAGLLGGLFGIGGGLIMVPLMALLMGFSQHKAQGTSLTVLIMPVAILAVMNYYKSGNVDFRAALLLAVGFVGGGYLGSKVSLSLDEAMMKKAFAIFLVAVAIYMWWQASQPKKSAPTPAPEIASP